MGQAASDPTISPSDVLVVEHAGLQQLIDALRHRGYRVIGPIIPNGAIVYDTLTRLDQLPIGWTDRQEAGQYRVEQRDDKALFGYAVGPHSWKRFLHPPVEKLWQAYREGAGFTVVEAQPEDKPFAFLGVRACELNAIAIQDRVFLQSGYRDPQYRRRRESAFIIAVNCGVAGGTCFCASMGTGPEAAGGFDLALTELLDDREHRFLLEVGSILGAEIAAGLPCRPASGNDIDAAKAVVTRTTAAMGRSLDTDGLKEILQANPDHPRWDDVATRCLACANCTMVCPTCFCTSIEDTSDLAGVTAERVRRWDSCFTLDFSYVHGGSVRQSTKARYRQWMTHKLANWFDQFGTSGCVGCGRCITWCPVGIDITQEAAAIRAAAPLQRSRDDGGA